MNRICAENSKWTRKDSSSSTSFASKKRILRHSLYRVHALTIVVSIFLLFTRFNLVFANALNIANIGRGFFLFISPCHFFFHVCSFVLFSVDFIADKNVLVPSFFSVFFLLLLFFFQSEKHPAMGHKSTGKKDNMDKVVHIHIHK